MKTFSSERSAVSSYGEHHPMTNQQQQYQRSGATGVVPMQHVAQQQQPTASQLISKNRRELRKRKQMARKFGTREILIVQSLIERCLTFYATKEEVIEILEKKCGIDEVISSVIWDKLEQQNEEFFKEYHRRLKMKERIEAFNEEICNYAQTIGIIPSEVEEEEDEEDGRNTMSNDENVNNNRSEEGSHDASEGNKQKKKKKSKKAKTKEAATTATKKAEEEKNKKDNNNNKSNNRTGTGALSGAVSAALTPLALAPGELRNLNDNPEADLPSMELSFEEEKDEIPLPQAPPVVAEKATAY
jgi:uncharacterized protein (TIGR01589 family)